MSACHSAKQLASLPNQTLPEAQRQSVFDAFRSNPSNLFRTHKDNERIVRLPVKTGNEAAVDVLTTAGNEKTVNAQTTTANEKTVDQLATTGNTQKPVSSNGTVANAQATLEQNTAARQATRPKRAAIRSFFQGMVKNHALKRQQKINRDAFSTMLALDDSLLKDIGVSRGDVQWAANLPLSEDAAEALYQTRRGLV